MPTSPTAVRVESLRDLAVEDLPLRGQDLERANGIVARRPSCSSAAVGRSALASSVDLVDRALHVEGALGEVVVLAVEDLAEAAHRLVDRHVLAARGR